MKILKVIHGYPPIYNAGSEVYSQSICNELSKTHEVHVFTREENPYLGDFSIRKEQKKPNLTLHIINKRFDKINFRNSKFDTTFESLLTQIKPDIVHIGHLNHLSTGIVDVVRRNNLSIVFTLHDFWLMCPTGQFIQRTYGESSHFPLCQRQEDKKCASVCYSMFYTGIHPQEEDFPYWEKWVSKRMQETKTIVDKVNLFIAPSKYLMDRFINEFGVSKEKIIYLDYGFPLNYLYPPQQTPQVFTFGYIGTHIPAKGVNLLIEAFIDLLLVIHEAQQCKIPVITADFGGMKEYVQHNVNGLLFQHRDKKDLTAKMLFALENENYMKTLGERGYLYSEDRSVISIEQHCQKLLEIYQKLIDKTLLV
ncbi:MAG: glycosyltransferase [Candidatus Pacearchaeota archaeon]